MVLNTILASVAAFVIMSVTATIIRVVGGGGLATLLGQVVTVGIFAGVLLYAGFVGSTVAGGLITLVFAIRLFAFIWFWNLGRKYLNGDYGKRTMWAAELAKEGDEEFIEAASNLTEMEMREVGIISDSKEELREMVVEEGATADES